jgi:hypothetical protein
MKVPKINLKRDRIKEAFNVKEERAHQGLHNRLITPKQMTLVPLISL